MHQKPVALERGHKRLYALGLPANIDKGQGKRSNRRYECAEGTVLVFELYDQVYQYKDQTKKISDSYKLVRGTALRMPICPISANSFHLSPRAIVWKAKPATVMAVATRPIALFLKARYVIYVIIASIYAIVDKPKKGRTVHLFFSPFLTGIQHARQFFDLPFEGRLVFVYRCSDQDF